MAMPSLAHGPSLEQTWLAAATNAPSEQGIATIIPDMQSTEPDVTVTVDRQSDKQKDRQEGTLRLTDLPLHVLEQVLAWLDLQSLARVSLVCRRLAGLRWHRIDCRTLSDHWKTSTEPRLDLARILGVCADCWLA